MNSVRMALLKELLDSLVGGQCYKHFAPNGAKTRING
jgi:hypothetical protein